MECEQKGVLLTGDESGRLAAWRPAIETIDDDVEMADAEISTSAAGMKRAREDDLDQVLLC